MNRLTMTAMLGAAVCGCGSGTPPKPWTDDDNWSMAYVMMEDFVSKRLRAPSTAEFPGAFDGIRDHVRTLGDQSYRNPENAARPHQRWPACLVETSPTRTATSTCISQS